MAREEPDEFELPPEPEPERAPQRSDLRPLTWAAAAIGLITVGSLVATPVPGLVAEPDTASFGLLDADLTQTPNRAWVVHDGLVPLAITEDRVVLGSPAVDGQARQITGHDRATGIRLWQYRDVDNTCQVLSVPVCVTDPGTDDAAVVIIDPGDGSHTVEPHPGVLAAARVDADLVVIQAGDAGQGEVVRSAPGGQVRWRTPVPVPADTARPVRFTNTLVSTGAGGPIDLGTGAAWADGGWITLGSGLQVRNAGDGFAVKHGETEVELEPEEIIGGSSDDIGGVVAVTYGSNGRLHGIERESGSQLWSAHLHDCDFAARVQGALLLSCSDVDALFALDVTTGAELWRLPGIDGPVVGAGPNAILVAESTQLTSLDPVTGVVLWNVPTDGTVTTVLADSDGLLVASQQEVQLLRGP